MAIFPFSLSPRTFLVLCLAFSLHSGVFAQANEKEQEKVQVEKKRAFSEEDFSNLQEDGALVLLEISAEWCSVCHHQAEVLEEYFTEYPDTPLHILTIDFDRQKPLVKRFEAPRQSTLILFRGKEMIWFSVAEMRREVIFAALSEAEQKQ